MNANKCKNCNELYDDIEEFGEYLERKLKREPYPNKNTMFDVIARFNKKFSAK